MLNELDQLKKIIEEAPEFTFSEEEKKEIFNQGLIKSFDGSFEFLVEFHTKLIVDYFSIQNARCLFFQFVSKILRDFRIMTKIDNHKYDYENITTIVTELRKITVPQYLKSNDEIINNPVFFKIFPNLGKLIRSQILQTSVSTFVSLFWCSVSVL